MKNYTKILFAVILAVFACAGIARADADSSRQAQSTFDSEVLQLLKSNNLSGLKTKIDNVESCDIVEGGQVPELCDMDKSDGKSFITHVLERGFIARKGYEEKYKDLTVISADVAIFDALVSIFKCDMNIAMSADNAIDNAKEFYEKYQNTAWLADKVEKTFIINQHGEFLSKYNVYNKISDGVFFYISYYVPYKMGIKDIYHNSTSQVIFDIKKYDLGRGRLENILERMQKQAKRTNSNELLKEIATSWFYSLIIPESQANVVKQGREIINNDEGKEKEYYQGKKQEYMYKFFNDKGWKMFADASVTLPQFDEQGKEDRYRKMIRLYARACPRVLRGEENYKQICSDFRDGAIKYNFYEPTEDENTEFQNYLSSADKKENKKVKKQLNKAFKDKAEKLNNGNKKNSGK